MCHARTFTLMRHGRSTYNELGLVNGDPSVPVVLTAEGIAQVAAARASLDGRTFDLAVHTRFTRTTQSLAILLQGRYVRTEEYPELDDVHLGIFEGRSVADYRLWRREHGPTDPPPGEGESRIDALYRYVNGFERLAGEEDVSHILAVLHDVPIRFLRNALVGADPLDGPVTEVANAEIVEVDASGMERALATMRDRLGR